MRNHRVYYCSLSNLRIFRSRDHYFLYGGSYTRWHLCPFLDYLAWSGRFEDNLSYRCKVLKPFFIFWEFSIMFFSTLNSCLPRKGASYLGIHGDMPLRNRLLWSLCFTFYVLCIVLPVTTYSILVPEERGRFAIVIFFAIFLVFPAIILGYFFEYYHHQKRRRYVKGWRMTKDWRSMVMKDEGREFIR